MKIAVTGGSGKVGKFILRELVDAGYQVVNLDRQRLEERICRSYLLDLTDSGQVFDVLAEIRPDAVVHAAANPDPVGHPRHRQFVDNIAICHSVMQASGDLGVRRLVYLSSEQANGWSSANRAPATIPFSESDMTPPESAYSLSKLMGEQILESMVATHRELVGVSLRINYVQTPDAYERMRPWMAKMGEHRSPNFWSYVDARDVARAVRLSVEVQLTGHRIYMVAAQDTFSEIPTIDLFRKHFGETNVAEGFSSLASPVDCRRIRDELRWEPQYSWRDAVLAA